MRLRSTKRAERPFRELPRLTALFALELLLLALIAIQAARLVWTLVTPVGPVGEWRTTDALALPTSDSALTNFDPFFRLAVGPAAVTSLNLKLHGLREDRGTGRGSAIIALPDGTQRNFVVGEEIMPGVMLVEVGFDSATINRNGVAEELFLDPSRRAQAADAPASAPATPVAPNSQIRFQPRMSGGRANGLVVNPGIDGGYALRAAGFMPGDVIVSINGQAVTSLEQARETVRQAGGEVSVLVRRGGRDVRLQTSLEL